MRISNNWLRYWVDLPTDSELDNIFEMAGLGVESFEDGVWSLEVTSNRGDCLCATGLAREIGAHTGNRVRFPPIEVPESGEPIGAEVQVEIENGDDCPRYAARLIENVRIGESPQWMQDRLTECGMRPVNNVVDITNFVMLEIGQPLHAFDASQVLAGDNIHRIQVRRARVGETLTTLDGIERTLNPDVLVIADSEKPIGVAGVMGGQNSEVTQKTAQVLLESAQFAPGVVRRGKRLLGIQSEAARRFERGIDAGATVRALDRAAQLLAEHAGATVRRGIVDRIAKAPEMRVVTLRVERANRLLGLNLRGETIIGLLERLGLNAKRHDDGLRAQIPSWRNDLTREVDLIEEVARVYGYEHIPSTLPHRANPTAGNALPQRLEERARETLCRLGCSELVTYSLESPQSVARAGLPAESSVRLRNPLSEDLSQLRTSLWPSLLQVLERNARTPVRFFELAKVYRPRDAHNPDAQQPDEIATLGLAMLDAPQNAHWQKFGPTTDFYTLKSTIEALLAAMNAPRPTFSATQKPWLHPGRAATVSVDGQEIGVLGEVHPTVANRYDLSGRAFLAQLDFAALVRHVGINPTVVPIARYPAAERDIALVVGNEIPAAQIEAILQEAGGDILEAVRVFDIYTGTPIPAGQKSVALSLRFRAANRTLTEVEVESAMNRLRQSALDALGAQSRA